MYVLKDGNLTSVTFTHCVAYIQKHNMSTFLDFAQATGLALIALAAESCLAGTLLIVQASAGDASYPAGTASSSMASILSFYICLYVTETP